ncbi:MAG: hypothetical protein AAGK67_18540, partial [Pseudomonadota bacterium]
MAFTAPREGVSLTPYSDHLANGLATVCYGETNAPMRRYTLAECKQMLGDSLAGYADKVRSLTPGFDSLTDGQKVAVKPRRQAAHLVGVARQAVAQHLLALGQRVPTHRRVRFAIADSGQPVCQVVAVRGQRHAFAWRGERHQSCGCASPHDSGE